MLKLKMTLCVMMQHAGRCRSEYQRLSVSAEVTIRPPAWIMQLPPDWQTPLNGIISPQRG